MDYASKNKSLHRIISKVNEEIKLRFKNDIPVLTAFGNNDNYINY